MPLPLGLDRFTFEAPSLIEWHQASVHFPIALLLTSVFCDFAGAIFKKAPGFKASGFRTTALWTQMLGTISAAFSVTLGWFGNPTRGENSELAQNITVHQWWGIAALAIFVVLSLWRLKRRQKLGRFEIFAYALMSVVGVLVISITGYLGAHIDG